MTHLITLFLLIIFANAIWSAMIEMRQNKAEYRKKVQLHQRKNSYSSPKNNKS